MDDKRVLRVLDANLNRAREGLRVLEDTARFIWERPALYRTLRSLRHRLDRLTRRAYPALLQSRDSARDAGRVLKEKGRRAWEGLTAANFRRSQEALRVLEEYGKVFSPGAASGFKSVRYRLYIIEKTAQRLVKEP
ncbi:MAG TPA: thiamine-phosphate pyrophosphorylase [Elusimicrobiota bacterium]|nr:thiamine-phosphate pyrophosphorylase [Elusimicrobiota bacterium]